MRTPVFLVYAVMLILLCGCARSISGGTAFPSPISPNNLITASSTPASAHGQSLIWGLYDLEIARDGSYANVSRNRYANAAWGVHLNAVKFLEKSPCTNCLSVSNVHLLYDGNLSVDISITHPFNNPTYTGFDVRGIIMFPATQLFPDNELRIQNGMDPLGDWKTRWSSADKGGAELVNAEGWTTFWAPDEKWLLNHTDTGYPIFGYYPGKYASGQNLSTLNPFRRFHSTSVRHMFGAGNTVTVTYIIRPPATGPIEASYAIYAHWAPPVKTPVTNPANDFGPEANSPLPYEFWVTQDGPIDPDKADHGTSDAAYPLHFHIKTWDLSSEYWDGALFDIIYDAAMGVPVFAPHPSGQPDDYDIQGFHTKGLEKIAGALPGKWPYIFRLKAFMDSNHQELAGQDWLLVNVDIDKPDGIW
jgi:hypothetical protein